MVLREAIALFRDHQKTSVRDKTRDSYGHLLRNLEGLLGDTVLDDVGRLEVELAYLLAAAVRHTNGIL